MNLSLFIAKRYLISKKSNNSITIISWISIVAIAITTAALVIILSAMNGLTAVVGDLYHAIEPDIKITSKNSKYISKKNELSQIIKSINGVNLISYSIEENALIKLDDNQAVVTIKGVDAVFKYITHFDTVVTEGVFKLQHNEQYLGVFGKGIMYKLGININDFVSPITLYAPKRGKTNGLNADDAFNKLAISPAGAFSLNDDFDFKYVFIDLKAAQQLFDCPNKFTTIGLSVTNKKDINDIQQQLITSLGENYLVKNRYQANDVLFKTIETEKLWTFIILAFILIIATFNIIGALTMLIIEKKKDIKTLYSFGADKQLVQKIFMTEGLLITAVGAITGLVIGIIVCLLQQHFHLIKFEDNYVISYYPIKMLIKDFIWIICLVMGIGFIAGIYPIRVFTRNDLMTNKDN